MRLVERDAELATLAAHLNAAEAGSGHLICLAAEAGGGKSALVQVFADSVASRVPVLTGWCDPVNTPRPAGPLLDMAYGLDDSVGVALRDDGRARLFEALLTSLQTSPKVLVFEDVHWADGTTLDVLRFLGRRIATLPTIVIATYREDEVDPAHPLRRVLGDLATQRSVHRMELAPLTRAGVAELNGDDALWERSGGNPFFVAELLQHAAGRVGADIPSTVTDSVLSRLGRLSTQARFAVNAAAVVGARAEPSVLLAVNGVGTAAIDELVRAGLIRFTPPAYTFRHELVRQAIRSVLDRGEHRALAAAALGVLRSVGSNDDGLARLAELAEAADDATAVLEFAPEAARRAAALGAHREAAAQYERALRFCHGEGERAELWERLAVERYLLGDLSAAITATLDAVYVRRRFGQQQLLGDDLRRLGRLYWYSGDGATAWRYGLEALECLEPLGPSPELAMALSQLSQLRMLAGAYVEAIAWGEQALELSLDSGLDGVSAHALNNVGTSRAAIGDPSGLDDMRRSLALALAINDEDHASRAYLNLGYRLAEQRSLAEALAVTEQGIEYCQARDLDLQAPYLRCIRAQIAVHAGRWDDAVAEARSVLRAPIVTAVHAFMAHLPLAVVAVRRGEPADLDSLGDAAARLDELQRLTPYACLRAEATWLRGGRLPPDSDVLDIYARGMAGATRSEMTELGGWLRRLGVEVAAGTPELERAEHLLELGNSYDAALCLLDGTESEVRQAAEMFASLGALPALSIARTRLRELGATSIPRRPRKERAADQFGLTVRQRDVLTLVADGLTNAQIADRLFLSERTVEHHVSAILATLGVASRDEAAAKLR